jgi:hypothetical protein
MATIMNLLPCWDVNGNAPVWLVWLESVRLLMRKKTLWVLVIGFWWKGESLSSIFILTSLFLIIFSNAFVWLIGCLGVVLSDVS